MASCLCHRVNIVDIDIFFQQKPKCDLKAGFK